MHRAKLKKKIPSLHGPDFDLVETVTLGERGQIVIPSEARKLIGFKTGEKLMVFANERMVCIAKADTLKKFINQLSKQLGLN